MRLGDFADFFVGDLCYSLSHRFHRFTQILDLFGRGISQIFLLEICVILCPTDFTDLHRFLTYAVGGFRRFFVRIFGGFFLPIMARMNLCKSVVSVGLFNGG